LFSPAIHPQSHLPLSDSPCILLFEEIDTAFTVLSDTTKKAKKKDSRGGRRGGAGSESDKSGSEESEAEDEEPPASGRPVDDTEGTKVTGAENKPVRF
jgi:hypothetical protein